MYSSKTNKMQRYTLVFITMNALHVSGCSSAHHQELKTVYTASGICLAFSVSYRYRELEFQLTHDSGKKHRSLWAVRPAMMSDLIPTSVTTNTIGLRLSVPFVTSRS